MHLDEKIEKNIPEEESRINHIESSRTNHPLKGQELLKYIETEKNKSGNNGDVICIGAGYGSDAKEGETKCRVDLFTTELINAKKEEHFKFIEAISNPSVLEISDGVSDETMALRKLLNQTIDEMELSVRSYNCLQAAGIKYIHELVSKEENQMLKYKNFGRKSLTELVEKLDSMGLHFGMEVDKIMAEEG